MPASKQDFEDVIDRFELNVEVPDPSGPHFVSEILDYLSREHQGFSVLAFGMFTYLRDECHRNSNFETSVELAQGICQLMESGASSDVLEVTAQEVRSDLFWEFVRSNHADIRMLELDGRLLSLLSGGDCDKLRRADAALSQGVNRFPQLAAIFHPHPTGS